MTMNILIEILVLIIAAHDVIAELIIKLLLLLIVASILLHVWNLLLLRWK